MEVSQTTELNQDLVEELARLRARVAELEAREQSTQEIVRRKDEALAVFSTLLASAPAGIAFLDRELRYLHINEALAASNGIPLPYHLGRTLREVFPQLSSQMEDFLYKIMETGEPVVGQERKTGSHYLLASYYPVRNQEGKVLGVGVIEVDITERKQMEEALKANEVRLRQISDSGILGIFVTDTEGRFTEANDSFLEMLGYSREEFSNPPTRWQELTPSEFWERDQLAVKELLGTGICAPYEKTFRRKNGELVPVLIGAARVLWPQRGAVGFVLDLSERKLAEEKIVNLNRDLTRRINEFQALFDMLPVGIGIAEDPECTRIRVNPAYARLLSINPSDNASKSAPPEEMPSYKVCQNGRELTPTELPMQYAATHKVEVLDMEADYVFEDGRVLKVLGYAAPLLDEEGQVIGSVGACLDITERKKAEEAQQFLAEASMLLASSLEYAATLKSVAYLAVSRVTDWCSIHLLDENEVVRHLVTAHPDPEKVKLARWFNERYSGTLNDRNSISLVLRSRQPVLLSEITEADIRNYAQDEDAFQFIKDLGFKSAMVVPMLARGRALGVISFISTDSGLSYGLSDLAVAEDLARRVALALDNARLYEEAQKSIERQKELDRLKDQFVSIASHELRTPLTSIKGYSQLLERSRTRRRQILEQQNRSALEEFEREGRIVTSIIHQANRMERLIGEMLDISRLQSGKFEIKPVANLNFVELVRRSIEQQQVGATDRLITLQTGLENLPLALDEARIEQVINNLLNNALKYSPADTPVLVGIEVRDFDLLPDQPLTSDSPPPTAEVICWVKDQGCGINPQEQGRIFERFYRAHNGENQNIDGLGLGLYISYEIIVRHGGRMWLESTPGMGSTFYFALPLQ